MHFTHHSPCTHSNTTVIAACVASSSTPDRKNDNEEKSCSLWCSSCGYLRYLLVFLGMLSFALDYILRFNLSVAIVAMVNNSVTHDVNSSYVCPAAFNVSTSTLPSTGSGEYNWSKKEQGFVLGTFFWGFVITKTVGGRISEILGPTFTVTLALGISSLLTLLTPTVADIHPLALAFLRLILGLMLGPISPAVYSIISRWTLPGETATMITVTFSGVVLGALVSLGLFEIVIDSFGWRCVFWGSGLLTLVWLPFWVIYVRDDPRKHPGISKHELERLSKNTNKPRRKVPWSRIFKSRHIYLFIMMEFVCMWTQAIIIMEGPTFLSVQIGMNLQTVGIINIVFMVTCQFCTMFYGWLSDLLESWEIAPMVTLRRIAQVFGTVMIVISLVGLAMAGCNEILVTVFLEILAVGVPIFFITFTVGPMIIAPNYAGTLTGILGLGDLAGFVLPMFVSAFIDKKNGWKTVFLVSAALNVVCGIIYIIWMPDKEEEWNMYEEIPGTDKHDTKKSKKRNLITATP